jgi:prepilin-type N-terminal cleavage/methylation domain-containing protein
MKMNRDGFTLVELLIAMTLLTVGLLAMLGSSALDTRAIMRERNIDLGAIYAARRLELLRFYACNAANTHIDSTEALMRGADTLAKNAWTYRATADGWQITLINTYFKAPIRMTSATSGAARRSDSYEAAVTCTS